MGTYLNPGSRRYEIAAGSEIYVDKSMMIGYVNSIVNTSQRYLSVSRPRRFGKSMAADMLCAYYDREAQSRALFEDKKIAARLPASEKGLPWDAYLGHFDVIRVVMTDFIKRDVPVGEALRRMQDLLVRDFRKAYPDVDYYDTRDLPQSMADVYAERQCPFVIIIDEWDAVFRVRKNDSEGQTKYLDFLRDWLKDKDFVALAYMTGILPIKKYGEHSALNMFTEYSMAAPMQLAEYAGFTSCEVSDLCRRYGRDYGRIKDWYDGYRVSGVIPPDPDHALRKTAGKEKGAQAFSLFNPLSVVHAVQTGFIRNYWNKTESYEALAEYIRLDYDGLKETVALLMEGAHLKADLGKYQNDMTGFQGKDDVLAMLVHLGYLGYDEAAGEVFIPNKEILAEFQLSTEDPAWDAAFHALRLSQELLHAVWAYDEAKVAALLEKAHDKAGNRSYNNEAALSYAIQYAFYYAEKYYTKILELDTGKGYADIAYLPSPRNPEKPALLVELKYAGSAEAAIAQIRRQEYPAALEKYKGNLILLGINYQRDLPNTSPLFKHHSCRIERA